MNCDEGATTTGGKDGGDGRTMGVGSEVGVKVGGGMFSEALMRPVNSGC